MIHCTHNNYIQGQVCYVRRFLYKFRAFFWHQLPYVIIQRIAAVQFVQFVNCIKVELFYFVFF